MILSWIQIEMSDDISNTRGSHQLLILWSHLWVSLAFISGSIFLLCFITTTLRLEFMFFYHISTFGYCTRGEHKIYYSNLGIISRVKWLWRNFDGILTVDGWRLRYFKNRQNGVKMRFDAVITFSDVFRWLLRSSPTVSAIRQMQLRFSLVMTFYKIM